MLRGMNQPDIAQNHIDTALDALAAADAEEYAPPKSAEHTRATAHATIAVALELRHIRELLETQRG